MTNDPAGNGAPRIFDFRVHSAEENLNGLTAFLDKIQERAGNIDQLRRHLDKESNTSRAVERALARIREVKQKTTPRDGEQSAVMDKDDVAQIQLLASQAENALSELKMLLAEAREKGSAIAVGRPDEIILKQNRSDLSSAILAGRKALNQIIKKAKEGGVRPWQNLRGLTGLWAGSLEYLAGLSLRHGGLGNRICEIADFLIRELQSASESLSALTIPGREAAIGVLPLPPESAAVDAGLPKRLVSRIVYLRFPEWTVWALPLAAYELWHIARVSVESNIATNFYSISSVPLDLPPDDPKHDHLADAFAVTVMGPAYACAALLLALDPLSKRDRDRAQNILYVLRKIGKTGDSNAFDAVADDLQELWAEAVDQAKSEPSAPIEDLIAWSDELVKFVASIPGLQFRTERWIAIRIPWIEHMREGAAELEITNDATIRFALTAAWKARMERPKTFSEIARRCEDSCRRIMLARSARSGEPPRTGQDQRNWLNIAS